MEDPFLFLPSREGQGVCHKYKDIRITNALFIKNPFE